MYDIIQKIRPINFTLVYGRELMTHERKDRVRFPCETKTFYYILDGCRRITSLVAQSRGQLLCYKVSALVE